MRSFKSESFFGMILMSEIYRIVRTGEFQIYIIFRTSPKTRPTGIDVSGNLQLRVDSGRAVTSNIEDNPHLDYGYGVRRTRGHS